MRLEDKLFGEEAEREVMMHLLDEGHLVAQSSGNVSEYDIICLTSGTKWEVKVDRLSHETGNAFIEVFNPRTGKQSGIMASESDVFVYCTKDKCMFIPMEKVRESAEGRNQVRAYSGNSIGFLLPIEEMSKISTYELHRM